MALGAVLVLLVTAALTVSDAAKAVSVPKSDIGPKKILVLLPNAAPSHNNVFAALSNDLLERGHHITFVSARALKTKHSHLREIIIKDPFEHLFDEMSKSMFAGRPNPLQNTMMMFMIGPLMTAAVFENPQALALKNEKFDLVISETFFVQEGLLAFAHHFGCPSMALNPFGYAFHMNKLTGGAINPSYVPNVFGASFVPQTLLERVIMTVSSASWLLAYHFYYLPKVEAQMRTVFPDAPPIYDLINNISLTLINNNDALMHTVPLAPSVIQVAGMHIKPGKPLPADLKKWIQDSEEGFVYFSLGSNLQANFLPPEKFNAILASFAKLKQRVLIKWNAKIPENAPRNCRFEEWVPQQEILAHPKLKVFVTHGGLLSTQESVYFGAPIIGMPVFGDQFMNMNMAVEKGFAVEVSIFDFTTEALDAALTEVINNPKYGKRSKELSAFFRLDPMPSLDKAVYYTEQLMKLGSFKHLQPSSVHQHWYQYLLLDVMAVILVGLYITWKVIRFVCSTLLGCCKSSKAKRD